MRREIPRRARPPTGRDFQWWNGARDKGATARWPRDLLAYTGAPLVELLLPLRVGVFPARHLHERRQGIGFSDPLERR